jgi:hypothetical protein
VAKISCPGTGVNNGGLLTDAETVAARDRGRRVRRRLTRAKYENTVAILRAQTMRLLNDARSQSFVRHFTGQSVKPFPR